MAVASKARSYEDLRKVASNLPRPTTQRARDVQWLIPGCLGLARGDRGHLEIYILGPALDPVLPSLRENLEHNTWYDATGQPFAANRLLLPPDAYFEQAAAFICTELIRANVDTRPSEAFARTEPIIEVWLERLHLSSQAQLGLSGELFVLEALIGAASEQRRSSVVDGWFGHTHSNRDLELPPVGIEVKTTTLGNSIHKINNPNQLELGLSVTGTPETKLFLASIGLQWTDAPNAWHLPGLIDRIISHLNPLPPNERARTTSELLRKIEAYGGDNQLGYSHQTMRGDPRFTRTFALQFGRFYDLSDPAIKVIRNSDLTQFNHVQAGSVSYQLHLPEKVSGALNPLLLQQGAANQITQLAGLN